MSSLYNSASLVMIPSGVKESKLYSIKPTDGSGDFTFSRGTDTATRVNASGLIEKERSNQLLHSNAFDNAAWTKTAVTITTGQSDPNGGTNAFKIVEDSTTNYHRILGGYTMTNGVVYATSVTAKAAGRNFLTLSNNVGAGTCAFDLTDGSLAAQESGVTAAKTTDLGGGWYRCEMVALGDKSGSYNVFIGCDDDGTIGTYLGDGTSGVLIYQSQIENSLVATDYIETTTAAVYEGITDNLPRLDYSGGASCPSLLLEPSRTNLVPQSEYIGSSWNPYGNISITTNAATSPEGVQNATEISATSTTTAQIGIQDGLAVTANTDYTISFFAKKGDFRYIQLFHGSNQVTSNARTNFDIQEGVVAYEESGVVTANVEDYGNGWYRCTATMEALLTTLQAYIVVAPTADAARSSSISATAGENYYIYGIQMEAGTYPTSYIPTYGTSASRAADVCKNTSATSLIGQAEGTAFLDITNEDENEVNAFLTISDNSVYDNHIWLGQSGTTLQVLVKTSGVYTIIQNTSQSVEGRIKIALIYSNNLLKIFVNGVQIYINTSAAIPSTFTRMELGAFNSTINVGKAKYNQSLLFESVLTDAECIALTTIA